jgi:hypothetical protein
VSPGGLLTVLLIDIFVLTWAIPALFAVMVGFLGLAVGFIISGIVTAIGGLVGSALFNFVTPFPGLATFFLGLMLASLGGLLMLAGIGFIKLFVKAIRGIIDWHGHMVFGRSVFKGREVEA